MQDLVILSADMQFQHYQIMPSIKQVTVPGPLVILIKYDPFWFIISEIWKYELKCNQFPDIEKNQSRTAGRIETSRNENLGSIQCPSWYVWWLNTAVRGYLISSKICIWMCKKVIWYDAFEIFYVTYNLYSWVRIGFINKEFNWVWHFERNSFALFFVTHSSLFTKSLVYHWSLSIDTTTVWYSFHWWIIVSWIL